MLLMIDNYDSFTYNVVQYLGELGAEVKVIRNDELTIAQIEALNPERIVVSLVRAPRPRPVFPSKLSCTLPASCRFSVSAWATSPLARPLAVMSCGPARSCMARPARFSTKTWAYLTA